MPRRASVAAALVALCAAAAPLAGCGADAGLEVRGPAPDSSAASLTEITGCSGRSEHAPARLILRCTAPRTSLEHLQWRGWGGPTATASGTLVTGNCTPAAPGDPVTQSPPADPTSPSCGTRAVVTASNLVLGTRADQYKALTVQTGTGAARITTRFDVDDRGPTKR